ncbi:adenosine deaminase/editase [Pavlovales sp. CCMP2436]|nr:adenosine deaminase/editase [Pavlovales sp. CCMP2436]
MADSDFALGERVALACIECYRALPQTGKPTGEREWTVLAGVALVDDEASGRPLQVVAIGSGTKCLPASVADADATGLRTRDGHAEVCARRAFRRYLCAQLRAHFDEEPSVVEAVGAADGAGARYRLRPSLTVVFFSSASPCGDASLFARTASAEAGACSAACAETEGGDDDGGGARAKRMRLGAEASAAEPEERVPSTVGQTGGGGVSAAVGASLALAISRTPGASVPGAVQRKPGRGEVTRSVSCSDKLALWAVLGLQGAVLSHLLRPIQLDVFVVGGVACAHALDRASWGRLQVEAGAPDWVQGPFRPKRMRLVALSPSAALATPPPPTPSDAASGPLATIAEAAGRVAAAALAERIVCDVQQPPGAGTSSSNSLNWSAAPAPGTSEAVNGLSGLKLGANKHKLSRKHGSRLSKFSFFGDVLELCARAPAGTLPEPIGECLLRADLTYRAAKDAAADYQRLKSCLLRADGPLSGWTRSPPELDGFLKTTNVASAGAHAALPTITVKQAGESLTHAVSAGTD